MDKVKKAIFVVLLDLVLIGIIIFSVYMMLNTKVGSVGHNVFKVLIVVSIPVVFFATYLLVAGNKYDLNEADFEDEPVEDIKGDDMLSNSKENEEE